MTPQEILDFFESRQYNPKEIDTELIIKYIAAKEELRGVILWFYSPEIDRVN